MSAVASTTQEAESCKARICEVGGKGLLMPFFGDPEQELRKGLRAVLYLLGLIWLLMAVANVSEVFMSAIECITSKKRRVIDQTTGKSRTVKVWNDTVANLTLMALGSSAPEILLSVIELLGNDQFSGDLGPSTIVGSAAFNLFCISAVCVMAIPHGEIRKIKDTNVYMVTAFFSIFAYFWLYLVVSVISEDIIDISEGIITFLFFPMLVVLAFCADKGYFSFKTAEPTEEAKETYPIELGTDSKEFSMKDSDVAPRREGRKLSKATYRVAATRTIFGGRRVDDVTSAQRTNLSAVVPVEAPPAPAPGTHAAPPLPSATVSFHSKNFAMSEDASSVQLLVRRTGDTSLPMQVDYKTRSGLAQKGDQNFEVIEGSAEFTAGEAVATFEIQLRKENRSKVGKDFFVDLVRVRSKEGFAALGQCVSARVRIVETEQPCLLFTDKDVIEVQEEADARSIAVTVRRTCGKQTVSCAYVTEAGTATEGRDYERAEGMLSFEPDQLTAEIELKVLGKGRFEGREEFRLILSGAEGGATFDPTTDGGEDSCIVTIVILPHEAPKGGVDRIMRHLIDWDKTQLGHNNWKDQFRDALLVNGGDEEAAPPSGFDWVMHIITVPWKVFFAIIPPTDYCGGWLCFFSALGMIGFVTALIGDLAALVGCVLNIPDSITAISLVALGTSLPDTLASKTAAEQDPYADASVGNVTGSNSVNVFLGLGLPWTIGSIYWSSVGRTDAWQDRYRHEVKFSEWNAGGGKFIVIGGDLGYSVVIFSCGALCCLSLLFIRRKVCGGELGGPKVLKQITCVILVSIWFVYIILSAVKSLETAASHGGCR
eukprot:TRINITY_DN60746_c0_g1_i1.p1 TRINITY_DN60746_c0_g1~~TRINITY_DN60746_c0_g1_i1.p1  ORF type:complete len:826 (+),score=124.68 TRINITY_DN60746_c0_g1_i1:83-2560(+)